MADNDIRDTTARLEAAGEAIAEKAVELKVASDELTRDIEAIKDQQTTQDDRLDVLELHDPENGDVV